MFKSYNVLGAAFLNRSYCTKRLTNVEKESFSISPDLHNIIIGSMLGDLNINKQHNNARLRFEQGLIHEAYIIALYNLFKNYCPSGIVPLKRNPDHRTGVVYTNLRFITYSLPCFNYYYDLFYVNGVKIVPLNIGELLTPEGLAYWAMDDGCKKGKNFYLSTDSYTLSEVELLIKVLQENFDLNCTYHMRSKDRYRIYIRTDSMDKFRSLVTPHFHSSMMYKLTV